MPLYVLSVEVFSNFFRVDVVFAAEIYALVGRLGDRLVEALDGGPQLAGARAAVAEVL